MVSVSVVVCFAVLATAAATNVEQCPGKNIANLSDDVQLTPCKSLPCKLKKGTEQHITIAFTPENDVNTVVNHVSAQVLGLPVPFIGVDGNSVCDKIYTESGEKAPCPLKAGTRYSYRDSFPVLQIYPTIDTKVHWALSDGPNEIVCFEVPVRITPGKHVK